MNIKKHIILIPVYNDWKSLNKLLVEINKNFINDKNFETEILIVDDCSTEKISINKNLPAIKKIEIITLKNNSGSQKAIAIGLFYLKNLKKNSLVTVMDGDGEDNPYQLKHMLNTAIKNEDNVVVSSRKSREESIIIIFFYKIHLILTFLFTFHWISFGNFTSFNSKNLSRLLSNNSSWYAHSSSVLKNCKIKKVYAKREKRYFDKSKLNFSALIEHSLRVNSVFATRTFISSIFYLILIFFIVPSYLNFLLIFGILSFNTILIFIKRKHYIKNLSSLDHLMDSIKSF